CTAHCTLSLHEALPICEKRESARRSPTWRRLSSRREPTESRLYVLVASISRPRCFLAVVAPLRGSQCANLDRTGGHRVMVAVFSALGIGPPRRHAQSESDQARIDLRRQFFSLLSRLL